MSVGFLRSGGASPSVGTVQDSSPAARAGLLSGDELLSANGKPIATMAPLHAAPGTPVMLSVKRGSVTHDVELVMGRVVESGLPVRDSSGAAMQSRPRCIVVEKSDG